MQSKRKDLIFKIFYIKNREKMKKKEHKVINKRLSCNKLLLIKTE